MSKSYRRLVSVFLILLVSVITFIPTQAQEDDQQAVARAILFYSPTCSHCENIIQNLLPPLLDEYGDQLKIVAINISLPGGQELYQAAITQYAIPDERLGVPTLIFDDVVMVGEGEIPAQFPTLIENSLSNGGTAWPDIPGLAEVIAGVEFTSHPRGNAEQNNSPNDTHLMAAKFMLDPVANSLSVAVLIGMLASVISVVISFTRPVPEKDFWPKWVIPVVSVAGMGVAFYLTYVETSGAEAFCGPVGDCNTVQLSPYATLFGVLPVGLLGLIGYVLLLAAWAIYTFGPKSLRWASSIALWGMSFFGVIFSIYLTFLEPFVIGATCMWCLSSAVFQTIIFLVASGPAKRAWKEDDFDDDEFEEDEFTIPDAEGEEPEDIQEAPSESGEEQAPEIIDTEEEMVNNESELEE